MLVQRRNKNVEKITTSRVYFKRTQNSEIEYMGRVEINKIRQIYSGNDYILVIKVVDFNIHTGFEREVYIYPSVLTIN